jgi:hypothetical protein
MLTKERGGKPHITPSLDELSPAVTARFKIEATPSLDELSPAVTACFEIEATCAISNVIDTL